MENNRSSPQLGFGTKAFELKWLHKLIQRLHTATDCGSTIILLFPDGARGASTTTDRLRTAKSTNSETVFTRQDGCRCRWSEQPRHLLPLFMYYETVVVAQKEHMLSRKPHPHMGKRSLLIIWRAFRVVLQSSK